jgi:sugar-specific transcriptional regulator TrmB
MDTSVLEDIGLSKNEISVFVKLLELGESKAGEIITKTGLQSSAVYNSINVLIEKGLISYIKKSQVKYYKAAEPETILDYIEKKKSEYLRLLPELKSRQTKNEEESVEFYNSFKGIKTIMSELEKDAKKGDVLRFFSIEDPEEYKIAMDKVFKAEKQLRKEKKLISKGIYHEKTRYMIKASSISKHRFVNFPMPPNTQILGDKVAIISWKGEEPSGILIKSKNIAKSYIDFFEHMWEKARE